ncbi:hypothetical protein DKX38_009244 [Salix brachista]|uniref:Uncharacterized protein n=1 Tax=Salix brachista TaxID=2182728 RepID=A0A5N5MCB2_9ROSI|nr:hypothetical protein DKX38_009244 [Salix brachista]
MSNCWGRLTAELLLASQKLLKMQPESGSSVGRVMPSTEALRMLISIPLDGQRISFILKISTINDIKVEEVGGHREGKKTEEYEPSERPEHNSDYSRAQKARRFMIYVHPKMMIGKLSPAYLVAKKLWHAYPIGVTSDSEFTEVPGQNFSDTKARFFDSKSELLPSILTTWMFS